LAAGLVAGSATASAQTLSYDISNVSTSAGAYSDLGSTGTGIPTANFDDANSAAQSIGFSFNYNGINYTQFVLNTNGYIRLGAVAPTFPYFPTGPQDVSGGPLNGTDTNLILPFNTDLEAGTGATEYRVATTGAVGSRVTTIQWKNVSDKTRATATPKQYSNFSFQVKLYEGSNNIQFVYGTATGSVNTSAAIFSAVGLKGSSTAAAQVLTLTKASTSNWSDATVQAGPYGAGLNGFNFRNTVLPDPGRTYTFQGTVAVDASVTAIYGFDQLVVPAGQPVLIRALVRNSGTAILTNRVVSLNITGSNTVSTSAVIASLASGASAVVDFPAVSTPNIGNNTVTVSVVADGNASNNSRSMTMVTNSTTTSYITPSVAVPTSYGFTTAGSGNYFAAKITLNQPSTITAVNAYLANDASNATLGQTVFGVVVDASTGAILARSADFVATASTVNQVRTFTLTSPLNVPAGDVLVGLAQVYAAGATVQYFPMGVQNEAPTRPNTFFTGSTTAPTTPTPSTITQYKYLLEAVTAATFSLTSRTPASNTVNAPLNTSIGLTFSAAPTAASLANTRVFGNQGAGLRSLSGAAVSGNSATLSVLNGAFKPGETVSVTVPSTITSSTGAIAVPYVYQFTTATTPSSGRFGTAQNYQAGTTPADIVLGDVTGDGRNDIVTVNQASNSLSLLPGLAGGGFGTRTDYAAPLTPYILTLGDVNGDGRLDVVATNNGAGANSVSVYPGTAGGLGTRTDYTTGAQPSGVALGDVNGDGRLDMVVTNGGSTTTPGATMSVYLNIGGGSFGTPATYTTGQLPSSVVLSDVNEDGRLDVVLCNQLGNTVSVLTGTGSGTFNAKVDYSTGAAPFIVTTGDFNADGRLDIAVCNQTGNSVSVLLNTGAGTFGARTDYATGTSPQDIDLADVNGDGRLDIVTANGLTNNVSVLFGTATGSFTGRLDFATDVNPVASALADINDDGRLDMVTANASSNTVSVLLGLALPAITSFTPASGPVGTSVVISGSNFSGTTSLTLNGQAITGYVVNAAGTTITFTVPAGASTGLLTVTTPAGTVSSTSAYAVTNAQLAVSQNGTAYPNNGSSFNFGTQAVNVTSAPVTFTLTNAGTGPLTISNMSTTGNFAISGTVPTTVAAGSTATVAVTFTPTAAGAQSGTLSITSSLGTYVVNLTGTGVYPAPTFSGINPSSGPVGTTVTVTGTNFVAGSTTVTLNGTPVTGVVVAANGNSFTFVVPAGATSGSVTITTPGGSTSSSSFCVQYTPTTTGASRCGAGTLTLTAAGAPTGGSYAWYTTATGNTPIPGATTSSFTTPSLSATTTYYAVIVTGTGVNACEGPRTAAVAQVNTVPTVAVAASGPVDLCAGSSVTLTASGADTYLWSNGATTASITVTTAGSYTVTGTSTAGCSATSTATAVTVTPLPSAPTTTPASRCGTGTLTLTAAGAPTGGSYAWYTTATGGTAIAGATGASYTTPSLSANTTYYVSALTASGCEGPRASVVALVNATPTVAVAAGGPLTFCQGGSVTLTASGADSYVWSNGATTASITVTTAGSYTVTGSSAAGCSATSTATAVTVTPLPSAPTTTDAAVCGSGTVTLTAAGAPTGGSYAWYTTATGGTAIAGATGASYTTPSLTATTTYYVSALSAGGCEGPRAAVVASVNATPTATVTAGGPLTFCQGGSVTLTATGGDTYLWSNGATTASITVSTSGSYTVTASSSAGCTAVSTATTVSVEPTPAQPVVTQGAPGVLTSSSATGNQWYLDGNLIPGATGQTYTVTSSTQNGTYTVVVTSAGGCASPASVGVSVVITGMANLRNESVQVYPNPAHGSFTVVLPTQAAGQAAVQARLVNAVGQVVLEQAIVPAAGPARFNVSGLATGVYLLQMKVDGQLLSRRVVVD